MARCMLIFLARTELPPWMMAGEESVHTYVDWLTRLVHLASILVIKVAGLPQVALDGDAGIPVSWNNLRANLQGPKPILSASHFNSSICTAAQPHQAISEMACEGGSFLLHHVCFACSAFPFKHASTRCHLTAHLPGSLQRCSEFSAHGTSKQCSYQHISCRHEVQRSSTGEKHGKDLQQNWRLLNACRRS